MSQDVLKQSLSSLIDNEADELELRRVLNASHEPEVRASWTRYQIARAAMHNEPLNASVDLSMAIMAAIEDEPAFVVAQANPQSTMAQPAKMRNIPLLGRVALAASVTLAVLGGVRFYNQDALQQDMMVAQSEKRLPVTTHSQSSMVLASYNAQGEKAPITQAVSGQDTWPEHRLPSYLRQHAQQSSVNKTESGLSYARTASLQGQ